MLKRALIFVFVLGMIWDTVTTYMGIIAIVGGINFVIHGMAFVGAAMIWGLNFYTVRIWRGIQKDREADSKPTVIDWVVRLFWAGALILDFYTSLTANYSYVPETNTGGGAVLIIIFITALAALSPMLVGSAWESGQRKKRLQEQAKSI